jgi:hypothetical protein
MKEYPENWEDMSDYLVHLPKGGERERRLRCTEVARNGPKCFSSDTDQMTEENDGNW